MNRTPLDLDPAKLPDLPSDLILLALADLKAVEASPLYTVNMSIWHSPATGEGKNCLVCLAGSVIANTYGVSEELSLEMEYIQNEELKDKMYFLDSLRCGKVNEALDYITGAYRGCVISDLRTSIDSRRVLLSASINRVFGDLLNAQLSRKAFCLLGAADDPYNWDTCTDELPITTYSYDSGAFKQYLYSLAACFEEVDL